MQAAWSAESVSRTISVPANPVVRIHNPRGDLEIRGWARDEVKVEGEDYTGVPLHKPSGRYYIWREVVGKRQDIRSPSLAQAAYLAKTPGWLLCAPPAAVCLLRSRLRRPGGLARSAVAGLVAVLGKDGEDPA